MPRNTQRVFLAKEYAAAPRNRFNPTELTIAAATATNITAQLPTQAQIGDAPCYDLLIGFNRSVVNSGLVGAAVTDDQLVTTITHPLIGDEEVDGIRIRGLFPRRAAVDTSIITPLETAAGARVTNWVYLVNEQAAGAVTVWYVFEVPDSDYE